MTTELRTLGAFDVIIDGRSSDQLKNRPVCSAMLLYVATERKVTRDSVLAVLWPDRSEARARHALSQTLYQLRRILGREQLSGTGQELRLADGVRVDTAEFERAVHEGRFPEAAALYTGRFTGNWRFRDSVHFQHWVDRQAERLAGLHRKACRGGIHSLTVAGDRSGARRLAEHWADTDPDDREAHLTLIRILIEDGHGAAALERYAAFERRLAASGLIPDPEIIDAIAPARAQRSTGSPRIVDRPTTEQPRIVVLPFVHAGPSRFAHMTFGLADETTLRLSKHPGLAVIARSTALRLAEKARSLTEIGSELNVNYVLDVTVRWSGTGSTGSAVGSPQLVRVLDGKQIWAAQLESDGDGFGTMHIRMADRTVAALGLPPITENRDDAAQRVRNPEAYELYLRGLQHSHQRSPAGIGSAIDLFSQAIELDEEYAQAYAGLALAYAMRPSFLGEASATWMPRAKRVAERALEMDPESADGHLARGLIAWSYDLDTASAGRHWNRVLELRPSTAQAVFWLAYRSVVQQRPDEARKRVEEGLALDPLSVSTNFDAGMVLWHLRDRTQALAQMRRVLQIDPAFAPAAFIIGIHHLQAGEIDDARREWSRVNMFGPSWRTLLDSLEDLQRAVAVVDRIVEFSPRPVHWYAMACLYVLLGAPDRALFWLEAHLRNLRGEVAASVTGGPSLFHMVPDPTFDALRPSPRFQALLRALHVETSAD